MKTKLNKLVLFALAVCISFVVTVTAHAQSNPLEKVAITGTAYAQSASTNDNGTKTTIGAPTKITFTTASILKYLAQDEGTTFPAGAKLDWNGTGLEVDQGTNEIQDVSDVISVSPTGQNTILSGTSLDSGNPPSSQSSYQLYTITYSGTTSGLSFYVIGVMQLKSTAGSANAKSGNYTDAGGLTFSNGTGEGQTSTAAIVVTSFTVSGSGSATENDGQGTD